MSFLMRYIIKLRTLIVISFLVFSCKESNKLPESKYKEHHTYSEFIDFLSVKTKDIDQDLDKFSFIREKTAELIDGGVGVNDVEKIDDNWSSWSAERFYNVFYKDSGTVKCGGASFFLSRVFNSLGYETEIYDMGCPGATTHQVTLVKNPGDKKYYVEDAFFNSTFVNDAGVKIPFTELLTLLSIKQSQKVHFKQGEFKYKPDFDTTGLYQIRQKLPFVQPIIDSIQKRNNNGEQLNRYQLTQIGFQYRCAKSECFLKGNYPEDVMYLYLFPLEHNSKKILKLIKETLKNE